MNLPSLAVGAQIIEVSSSWSNQGNDGPCGAINEIDGSAWSSNGDGAFIVVSLPKRSSIGEIGAWARSMSDRTAQTLKFILTIDDGGTVAPFQLPNAAKP
jgi:hypothetical protein